MKKYLEILISVTCIVLLIAGTWYISLSIYPILKTQESVVTVLNQQSSVINQLSQEVQKLKEPKK